MDPIKIKGIKIIDTDLLKTSGIARIVLELTEQDSLQYYGSFSVAEVTKLAADVEFKFTEIEGNNNGSEEQVKTVKSEPSIYSKFRLKCIEYSGPDYYGRLKKHLGVEHLEEIENKYSMSESMVEDVLFIQECWIWAKSNNFDSYTPNPSALNHKDNSVAKWKELFESFNNPKNA